MPTMTEFHTKFSAAPEVHDPLFQGLIEVARADLGLFQVLEGGWDSWTKTPTATATL